MNEGGGGGAGGGAATKSFVALEEGRIVWHLTRSKKPITRMRSYLVKLNSPGLSCLLFLGALIDTVAAAEHVAMYLASSACIFLAAWRLRSVAAGGELRKDRRQASNVWWVVSAACSTMGCKSIPAPTVTASEQQSAPWKLFFGREKKKWNSRHEICNKCMQTSAPRWLSSRWLECISLAKRKGGKQQVEDDKTKTKAETKTKTKTKTETKAQKAIRQKSRNSAANGKKVHTW